MTEKQRTSSRLTCAKGADVSAARRLLVALEKSYKAPIDLKINANSSTLLSIKYPKDGTPIKYSVHFMFLNAPADVVEALGDYLKKPTDRCRGILRDYMDSQPVKKVEILPERVLKLRSRGAVYDLHKLADSVNHEFFSGKLTCRITWSKGAVEPRDGRRRHIIFGSYDSAVDLIRIHPALDQNTIPEFFIKFVIYHEMLHAVLDTKPQPGGRRCVHTAQFRDKEKRHPDYKRAMEWERSFMKNGA